MFSETYISFTNVFIFLHCCFANQKQYLGNHAHSQIYFQKYTENFLWNITAIIMIFFVSIIIFNGWIFNYQWIIIKLLKQLYWRVWIYIFFNIFMCKLNIELLWKMRVVSESLFYTIKIFYFNFHDIQYLTTKVIGCQFTLHKKMRLEKQNLEWREMYCEFQRKHERA